MTNRHDCPACLRTDVAICLYTGPIGPTDRLSGFECIECGHHWEIKDQWPSH